jgi:hypothetical protein
MHSEGKLSCEYLFHETIDPALECSTNHNKYNKILCWEIDIIYQAILGAINK